MLWEHMVETQTYNYFKSLEDPLAKQSQSRMSDKESEEGSAGNAHPPAVKAGGMRIVQKKTHRNSAGDDATVPQVEGVPHVQNSPPKAAAYLKGDNNVEFSAKAVQAFHEKPEPSRNPNERSKPHVLHQPRK